jgi:transcriptional regulator with XRE-family HTH domain
MKSNADDEGFGKISRDAKVQQKREFARLLRNAILGKGWSQADLARHADLGRDSISSYCNGRTFPEPVSLKKIADALGKTVEEMRPVPLSAISGSKADIAVRPDPDDAGYVYLSINRAIPMGLAADIIEKLKGSFRDSEGFSVA